MKSLGCRERSGTHQCSDGDGSHEGLQSETRPEKVSAM